MSSPLRRLEELEADSRARARERRMEERARRRRGEPTPGGPGDPRGIGDGARRLWRRAPRDLVLALLLTGVIALIAASLAWMAIVALLLLAGCGLWTLGARLRRSRATRRHPY